MSNLYMLLMGCSPAGRNIEQHDVYFGIGANIRDIIPDVLKFWPGAGKIHLDAWREIHKVDGFEVKVLSEPKKRNLYQLFFVNLGGYKKNEFEEFHYKMITVAMDRAGAIASAKQTAFYKHTGFRGAPSHIDDKYGIDVDDVYAIRDILSPEMKDNFHLSIEPATHEMPDDEIHLGYFRIEKVDEWAP